jgi:hypothetical protein
VSEDLAAFYRARLDEAEEWWRSDEARGAPIPIYTGSPEPSELVPDPRPGNALREISVERAILHAYEEALQSPYGLPEGVYDGRDDSERLRDEAVLEAMESVVRALASIYDHHSAYRQEWKP